MDAHCLCIYLYNLPMNKDKNSVKYTKFTKIRKKDKNTGKCLTVKGNRGIIFRRGKDIR